MSRSPADGDSAFQPQTAGWPLRALLAIATLEVVINRVAVPSLRPAGVPPGWFVAIDYVGLFLFYFTGTLAAALIGARCVRMLSGVSTRKAPRELIAYALFSLTAAIAAAQLVITVPESVSFALELGLAATAIALVATAYGRGRDLGIAFGLPVLTIPLLVHVFGAIGDRFLWPENAFDGPALSVARLGVGALCLAALASPYCFAPRPFARAVTRPGPIVFAMTIAAAGAVATRFAYPEVARAASLAFGVELNQGQADPRLALYLLAFATLSWTLASCAFATSAARRHVGAGLALLVLGGYGFRWPNHYLLPLLGLALIAEAARTVRDEELADMPITADTPPINDVAWSAYIAAVATGLKRTLTEVHSLTTRGGDGLTSSVLVGELAGITVRTRIERHEGSVIGLDIVAGREVDETVTATVTLWAIPAGEVGSNPPAPSAAPAFKTGDAAFDDRFRARGKEATLGSLLDAPLRARAVATLDGWLAYWEPDGLRYRVYPTRGAPLDHPIPVSDLATGRAASAERLIAVVELIAEIAARGVKVVAPPEPTELDAIVAEAP